VPLRAEIANLAGNAGSLAEYAVTRYAFPTSIVLHATPPAVVDVAIVQVVGQLSDTTGVVPFMTKPAPPLWTITGSPPSSQNGPTGGVVVDP
jgi:hypothetical protein